MSKNLLKVFQCFYKLSKIPPYISGLKFVYAKETQFNKSIYFITNLPGRDAIGLLTEECLTFVD
jgi:hypothetical protein